MTPAEDADAASVYRGQIGHRPVSRVVDIINFGAAVVDLVVEIGPMSDAATIFGGDDDVATFDRLAKDVRIRRGQSSVHSAMREDEHRRLPPEILRREDVYGQDERITG